MRSTAFSQMVPFPTKIPLTIPIWDSIPVSRVQSKFHTRERFVKSSIKPSKFLFKSKPSGQAILSKGLFPQTPSVCKLSSFFSRFQDCNEHPLFVSKTILKLFPVLFPVILYPFTSKDSHFCQKKTFLRNTSQWGLKNYLKSLRQPVFCLDDAGFFLQ